ncbi:Multiple RNA-binding domain-containing protein 1 [Scheffersomyces spartinae]|uniref:Multiple RNA-binding domain-containing protein 1 n=1 Tax=Scheffersomyces spartinae TaxID=45513 RepID=A0A9P7VA96_9ASCO|nr:Multiple RNA-binding domain-containing protein 1 [Scheffersomyces spartinae]KAG7194167.1 Multiple RNA-binding domain-containing protein 1 [Scheffersomyces spartinae]
MSRLIVKGLPQYLTEDRLKEHFTQRGNVSDVKLMKKRNGESRRFAFVGYKSDAEAEKAVRFFNGSFIDTSKISVEVAKTFSDPTVPLSVRDKKRLMSQRLAETEDRLVEQEEKLRGKNNQQRNKKSKIDEEINSNPQLREFMDAMKPSAQTQSWANDGLADGSGAPGVKELEDALDEGHSGKRKEVSQSRDNDVALVPENESDDEYEDFGKKVKENQEDYEKGEDEEEEEEKMISLSELPLDSKIAADENVSDMEWLRSKRIRMKENENQQEKTDKPNDHSTEGHEVNEGMDIDNVEEEEEEQQQQPVKGIQLTPEQESASKIAETGRLFIRNILYDASEDEFRKAFELFGELEEVHIAIDTRTNKSKGFVYIQFKNPNEAVSAYRAMDKQIFQGRILHILPGEKKKSHRLDEFDLKNLPLKKQRELKKKAEAGKSQFSWNSLFMNQDAVMESVASKLGVTKAQLIDPHSSSSAVKQALAEAHVLGDVRKYFEDRGVDLTQFQKKERDDKIILVKNFPFGTTAEELGELFSTYGPLKRILMPPAGTIAIVEFVDAPSARAAFTKLAYRRFKKGIIYLEKGPKGLFIREPTKAESSSAVNSEVKDNSVVVAAVTADDVLGTSSSKEVEETEVIEGPTVSVFVKNLNFSTTTAQLGEFFKGLPGFVVATVKTKKDPKNSSAYLSMGFGFVEFKTKEQAEVAIRTLDGKTLDGHKLQLKLSHRQGSSTGKNNNNSSNNTLSKSNKLIIKNLPFEASRKDVLELFGSFGQVKSVRVPKKFDKSARGFAFVEYTLTKEAENAMNQLEGVHLLGRRLVMQYAEQESEDAEAAIEKMTRKVKKQVDTQQMAAARLAGKGKIDLEEEEDDDTPF